MQNNQGKQTAAIKRAVLIGPLVAALLLLCAGLMYLAAGLIGWSGGGRILIALCTGPFLGFGILGAGWLIFRPRIGS